MGILACTRRERSQHLRELVRVSPGVFRRFLRTTQFRGGDHLHGLRDLLGIADRGDPFSYVLETRHSAPLSEDLLELFEDRVEAFLDRVGERLLLADQIEEV